MHGGPDGMSDDGEVTKAREILDDFASTHRIWVLPVLRALVELGGKAKPVEVEERIRTTGAAHLTALQWAFVVRNRHIRWARFEMRRHGLIGGAHGTWEVTEQGRQVLAALSAEG